MPSATRAMPRTAASGALAGRRVSAARRARTAAGSATVRMLEASTKPTSATIRISDRRSPRNESQTLPTAAWMSARGISSVPSMESSSTARPVDSATTATMPDMPSARP